MMRSTGRNRPGPRSPRWRERADRVADSVTEVFVSVEVADVPRAAGFYRDAFGATVEFASESWASVRIAGVRLALVLSSEPAAGRVGLHVSVRDLFAACAAVELAGGSVTSIPVALGVEIVCVTDSEGNTFTLTEGGP